MNIKLQNLERLTSDIFNRSMVYMLKERQRNNFDEEESKSLFIV